MAQIQHPELTESLDNEKHRNVRNDQRNFLITKLASPRLVEPHVSSSSNHGGVTKRLRSVIASHDLHWLGLIHTCSALFCWAESRKPVVLLSNSWKLTAGGRGYCPGSECRLLSGKMSHTWTEHVSGFFFSSFIQLYVFLLFSFFFQNFQHHRAERQGQFHLDSFTLCDSSYDSKSPERWWEQKRDGGENELKAPNPVVTPLFWYINPWANKCQAPPTRSHFNKLLVCEWLLADW